MTPPGNTFARQNRGAGGFSKRRGVRLVEEQVSASNAVAHRRHRGRNNASLWFITILPCPAGHLRSPEEQRDDDGLYR